MARRNQEFQTVRSEGGILPADLLRRVIDPQAKLEGTTPGDYGLPSGERLNDVITQSWNRLRKHWADFRAAAEGLPETDPATGLTNDKWNLPVLRELGFGLLPTSAGPEIDGRTYPINRFFGPVPIHLVGQGVFLDRKAAGVRGAASVNPHGLVQEFLNRSSGHLWAILSNGLRLRVLRDNQALSRQSFLEFDLEAMFQGEAYSDFVLFWLMAHATRFAPTEGERPETCWLERWAKLADEQGTRALGDLRGGVERALQVLGEGFTSHPKNTALRDALRTGTLPLTDFHGQLLRVVYRLIFLFVAEDRILEGQPLLHPRDDSESAKLARERYSVHYGTARLREMAGKIKGSRHGDLWRQFQLLVGALSSEPAFASARDRLALPTLGSFLWNPTATAALNDAELTNFDFLESLRNLAFTRQGKSLRTVDYRNLGAEELGGVYESLLALTPQISADGAQFTFPEFAGNERKTTGSYYTRDSLVQCLLDSALDPIVKEAIKGKIGPDAEKAILSLRVCDPAVGSGHFLVGAAHRLARHLARVRARAQGESEPSPILYQHALRDTISRCLYGVDINPMAAELCRVSLWLEALDPAKPLSFLDHHIRVGNSLLGATPELVAAGLPDETYVAIEGDDAKACSILRKRNSAERAGIGPLFAKEDAELHATLQDAASALDKLPDDRLEDIHIKAEAFRRHEDTAMYRHKKSLADAWCAAFLIHKQFRERGRASSASGISQGHLNQLAAGSPLPADVADEVERLASRYQFFHWHLAFPEIASRGGFDAVVGNPPWDTLSPDSKEFFSIYDQQIRFEDKVGQGEIITRLTADDSVASKWSDHCRSLYAQAHFIKHSGVYRHFAPGNLGKGDFNIYRMFVEKGMDVVRRTGWLAQIVPENFYNGANAMAIRKALFDHFEWKLLLGFENAREVWFTGIDTRTKFCLYAARKAGSTTAIESAFCIRSVEQLRLILAGSTLHLPVGLVYEFSPEALAIMEFTSHLDIDIATKMYAAWPKFGDEAAVPPRRHYMREFDMGNDREQFGSDPAGLPLYEGRMIDAFDYRAKGYRSGRGRSAVWVALPFGDPEKSIQPQWRVSRAELPEKLGNRPSLYRIGFCDVGSPTNERTLFAALIPPNCVAGDTVPTITFEIGFEWLYMVWVAVANSFAMDFLVRKKVSLHIKPHILDSLPFPRPSLSASRTARVVDLAARLTCTGPEMLGYWKLLAHEGWIAASLSTATPHPSITYGESRAEARAELDAIIARDLYGLSREELTYVLDGFPIVRERDEAATGEFRTKRTILEFYDASSPSIDTNSLSEAQLDQH